MNNLVVEATISANLNCENPHGEGEQVVVTYRPRGDFTAPTSGLVSERIQRKRSHDEIKKGLNMAKNYIFESFFKFFQLFFLSDSFNFCPNSTTEQHWRWVSRTFGKSP